MTLLESKISNMIVEEFTKNDLTNYIKNDRDFEKKVREIAADVIVELYRVLWQHNDLFKNLARK